MLYIYTADDCPKCVTLKRKLNSEGTQYTERSASRIKLPEDDIDREALVEASMYNMELPVVVTV